MEITYVNKLKGNPHSLKPMVHFFWSNEHLLDELNKTGKIYDYLSVELRDQYAREELAAACEKDLTAACRLSLSLAQVLLFPSTQAMRIHPLD